MPVPAALRSSSDLALRMLASCSFGLALALAATGCGLSLKEQAIENDDEGPDGGTLIDGGVSSGPVCSNGRVVFLQFEGVTLTRVGAGLTDATANRVEWLPIGSANVPAYLSGSGSRATVIQQITDAVRQTLGAFPVTVVTERPAVGPYHMVVFGGRSDALGIANDAGARTAYDCANLVQNNAVWISEKFAPADAADYAVGGIGLGLGLAGTLDPSDCMCGWGNSCVADPNSACTFSAQIINDGGCSGGTPTAQNEVASFRREFCEPRP